MIQAPELNQLIWDLSRAPREVQDEAGKAVQEVIGRVEDTGKAFAPVREGTLRDSISSETSAGDGMVQGEAGPTARHGRFVEWGTYKDAPQAFMGPALDRHSHELDELLGSAGERAISRFGMTFR
jgi:HK97 gp10 family phage protein